MLVKAMATLLTLHTQPDEIRIVRSCNAGSFSRRRKFRTICSTKAACGRGKIDKLLRPLPGSRQNDGMF
jgi:hypothetical protein